MSLLATLRESERLRAVDLALADTLRRLDPSTPDAVLAAAALASFAVAQGHAAFDPAQPRQLVDAALPWPDADAWAHTLQASRFVATPASPAAEAAAAPLAFEHGLLYLRRYREYERRLALRLQRIAAQPMPATQVDALAPLFARLFAAAIPTIPTSHATLASDTDANGPPSPPAGEGQGGGQGDGQGLLPVPANEGSGANESDGNGHLPPLTEKGRGAGDRLGEDDRQARAAALALRRALLLVTGGPGTGKTTTIARLLALRIAQARHAGATPPRIALAAPTGRAADRMADSLRRAIAQMDAQGIDADLLAALPREASTLHRLLRTIPESPRFRHDARNPLPFDIVVVDEASMVDLPLMCKLAEAVPDGAQLVLLGDADQLPSVEAGDVLAAILAAAGPGDALLEEDAQALRALSPSLARGARSSDSPSPDPDMHPSPSPARAAHSPDSPSPAPGLRSPPSLAREARRGGSGRGAVGESLHGHRIHLTRGWRQHDALHLAPLADAVRDGDAPETLRLLRSGELSNVHFHEDVDDPLRARPQLLDHWRALAALDDPAQALQQANRLRLLAALREGPLGARGLNARIETALAGAHREPYFPGRLLLVVENSYRNHLFNGDVGVCLAGERGAPLVWFPGRTTPGQAMRAFHPSALPAHESAFATTVHKAQGSEFDEVWLQLPRADSRILSRELLYTGITRARNLLHIAGSVAAIEAALARHAGRVSGLGWRLE